MRTRIISIKRNIILATLFFLVVVTLLFLLLTELPFSIWQNKPGMAQPIDKFHVYFEENQGQAPFQVKFIARGNGYTLFLTDTEAVLALQQASLGDKQTKMAFPPLASGSSGDHQSIITVFQMALEDTNPSPRVIGLDELPGKVNYFLGNDPTNWVVGVPTFARVRYENIYPGIDLFFYVDEGILEYDFVVAPGGDPGRISLNIHGDEKVTLEPEGDLLVQEGSAAFRMWKPFLYQDIQGRSQPVAGKYFLAGPNQVGFRVGTYDRTAPLVVDPVLDFSTFLSGTDAGSYVTGVAVDASGNVYVTGATSSLTFPTTPGAFQTTIGGNADAFITKFDPSGSSLVYSTYLGGSDHDDLGTSVRIAVDSAGNAYVAGTTVSTDFPTTSGAFQPAAGGSGDVFAVKLNPAGDSLEFATYLGGSGIDYSLDMALNAAGEVYVTGTTNSSDFPLENPFQETRGDFSWNDAFVTRFSQDGSGLVYSTLMGGNGRDEAWGIAVDGSNSAYITGATFSSNYTTTVGTFQPHLAGGLWDAFVTKFNPAGNELAYSSYLGGSSDHDWGHDIAVDDLGSAYLTGGTRSIDDPGTPDYEGFPVTQGAFQQQYGGAGDAYVAKVNPTGSSLTYSSYLGGSGGESLFGYFAIAVDGAGVAYLTGTTDSPDFPTMNPLQPALNTTRDAFVVKVASDGSALLFSTYYGGSYYDHALNLAVDDLGHVYIGGGTQSGDFPTTPGAFQTETFGDAAFVLKIDTLAQNQAIYLPLVTR